MPEIKRKAEATWDGDLQRGQGLLSTGSGTLNGEVYTFGTRFQNTPGTNPEELIAAAHAACFNMALAHTLSTRGYKPERLETDATATLTAQPEGGFRITKMRLDVRATVPGIDETSFLELAEEAEGDCPVSQALRAVPAIELVPALTGG